jgi:cytochrome oxidase assembly protein ShyY1
MGVSADPKASPGWRGGEVTGRIAAEPSRAGLADRLLGKAPPPRPMIVAERPAAGLAASAPPAPDPANSSRSYALQWFFFAAAAGLIYLLALRGRRRESLPPSA